MNSKAIHKPTSQSLIRGGVTLIALLVASATGFAQTTPPTPQSVAPGYTAPQSSYNTGQPMYTYVPTRAGTWDFYLNVGYSFYDNTSLSNQSIYDPLLNINRVGNLKFDFDDAFTFGFGLAYNINDKLAVGAEFSFSQPDYNATFTETSGPNAGTTYRVSGDADIYTGNAFIQYNITNSSKLTPYIRGNIGFAWVDTGIPTGPTEYYWWWDWWWGGYYVVGETPTQSDTYFTIGATAGLRYDFGNHVFLTAAYDATWVDTPHDWSLNQRMSLSVGWNY